MSKIKQFSIAQIIKPAPKKAKPVSPQILISCIKSSDNAVFFLSDLTRLLVVAGVGEFELLRFGIVLVETKQFYRLGANFMSYRLSFVMFLPKTLKWLLAFLFPPTFINTNDFITHSQNLYKIFKKYF